MDIVSLSPFRTGSLVWQPRKGRFSLTVVCKATYALEPGESGLAAEQEDVNEHENHWDDDPRRSLYAPSDLVPFKARADVMLIGHAFAPPSEPVRSLVARLRVGELDKSIEVVGPRVWTREGELREGTRWVKMPLRYERAAGGPSTWNPVGVSADSPLDPYGQRPLPNLQRPGQSIAKPSDPVEPIGFGPIASSWQLRKNQLGRFLGTWSDRNPAATPLEEDFDGSYFQSAPPDQQAESIRDDERIVLDHLHPEHPQLSTTLSGVHPKVFVDTGDTAPWDLVMTADTLWIDTDRAICTLTWRGQIGLSSPDQPGRVIVAMEERGRRISWANIAKIAAAGHEDDGGAAVPTDRRPRIPALRTLVSVGVKPGAEDIAPPEPSRVEVVQATTTLPSLRRTLPFGPGEPTPSPAADAAQRAGGPRQTLTLEAGAASEIQSAIPAWVAPPQGAASQIAPAPGAEPEAPQSTATPIAGAANAAAQAASPAAAQAAPPPSAVVPPLPVRPPSTFPPPEPSAAPEPLATPVMAPPAPAPVVAMPFHELEPSSAPPPTPTAVATAPARNAPAPAPVRVQVNVHAGEPSVVQPTRMGGTPIERIMLGQPAPPPALELLWLDPSSMAEVRATWASVLRPLVAPASGDGEARAMRVDLASVLSRGSAANAADLESLMLASEDEGGGLVPPLALLHGDVELALASSPYDPEGERALLEARRYEQRDLLGATFLRALFRAQGSEETVPLYLPVELARRLPLFRRFAARLVAEVRPSQDEHEEAAVCLRAVALGRVIRGR
ncbi:MAG: DUF2169 domain-containing protein [Byssovorax sp.]